MNEPVSPKKQAPMPSSPLRKKLRAEGHALKPLVRIGTSGVTEGVVEQIRVALAAHELVKISVSADAPEERFVIADQLAEHGIQLVQVIGRTILAYQAAPKKKPGGAASHAASKPRRRQWPPAPGERDASSRPRAPAPPSRVDRERPPRDGGATFARSPAGAASFGPPGSRAAERPRGGASFERPRGGPSFERPRGGASFERPRGGASFDGPSKPPGGRSKPGGRGEPARPTGTGRGRALRGRSGGEWDRPGVDRTRPAAAERPRGASGGAPGRAGGGHPGPVRASGAAGKTRGTRPVAQEEGGRAGERGWMGERGRAVGERGRPTGERGRATPVAGRRTFKPK